MPTTPSVIWVFIAGMATVITPCVLPVLPAMLSGSMGSRLRPVVIVTGMFFGIDKVIQARLLPYFPPIK